MMLLAVVGNARDSSNTFNIVYDTSLPGLRKFYQVLSIH